MKLLDWSCHCRYGEYHDSPFIIKKEYDLVSITTPCEDLASHEYRALALTFMDFVRIAVPLARKESTDKNTTLN